MISAGSNIPISVLLDKVITAGAIEISTKPADTLPGLYLASSSDAPRPNPLTTVDELAAPEPYAVLRGGQDKILYLMDLREG